MNEQGKDLSVNARIYGHVQGVLYRRWAEAQARSMGLKGWVRNRLDGSVEAVFDGDAGSVDAMIEACEMGPPNARVQAVDITPCPQPTASRFKVRRTK